MSNKPHSNSPLNINDGASLNSSSFDGLKASKGSSIFSKKIPNKKIYKMSYSEEGNGKNPSSKSEDFVFNVSLPLAEFFYEDARKSNDESLIYFLREEGIPFTPKDSYELSVYIYVHWQFSYYIEILKNYGEENFLDKLKTLLRQRYNLFTDKYFNYYNCQRIAKKAIKDLSTFKTNFVFMVNLTKENNLAELIRENKVLYLNKELINMALKSNGALNLYIRVQILKHFFIYLMETQSISEEYIHSLQSFYNSLTVIDNVMISFYENINKCRITKDVYDHYLRRFFIDDDNESEFKKDIEEIKQKLNNIVILKDEESLQNLEDLSIKLLGHPQKYKRNEAVIILNVIYDQTPFQLNSHFKSGQIKISYVSEELKLVLRIRKNDFKENSTILIMSAPSQKSVEDGYGVNFFVPKKINPIDKETYQIIFNFGKVMHCGYYDWYLLKIKGGIYYNIEVFCDQIKKFSEGKGRFVVLNREIRDLAIHEVCCDYLLNDQNETNEEDIKKNGRRDGARSRKESNVSLGRISGIYWGIEEYNNRGTFQTLTAQLDLFQERNINCLYIMGALERDNEMTYESDDNRITSVENPGAAPLGVISRDTISNFLGGPLEFTNLVSKAKNKGIKIIIDALIKIAAANIGSQYKNLLLKYKYNNKIIQPYYFTNIDCLAYENSTMLNS